MQGELATPASPFPLPSRRRGYAVMVGKGLDPQSADEVLAYLKPLPGHGAIGRNHIRGDNVTSERAKRGNSAEYLLRRLNSRGHKDLARRVVMGELSAHAAAPFFQKKLDS